MLRKLRLASAVVCFALITLLFLDFTGTLHGWLGWLAKIQFVPAVLALNVGVVLGLLLLTLLFGRIYCSVICPLGVFQDVAAWMGKRRKKSPYSYSPPLAWLRYSMLGLFVVALVAGIGSLAALLEPYSAYGRMAHALLLPLWQWGNNLLALLAERTDSYAFYQTQVWVKSIPVLTVAASTFVLVVVVAWRNGRTYCNAICPVGTLLGLLSRFSLYRVTIDLDKCNKCGRCARHCKAACINPKKHQIDYSRCVACMDCLGKCKQDALQFKRRTTTKADVTAHKTTASQVNETRRGFLSATALLATTSLLKAQEKKVDGGLAIIEDKKIPHRVTPIAPPGATGTSHFAQHCTACQLCITVCPNQVLRPSGDLMKLMQPEVSYERGYCRPECVKCSEVCPAGAIKPITKADKSSIQVGRAVWIKANCVPLTDGMKCGNCARHCPTGAIQMITTDSNNPDALQIPAVDVERCIGCGACENLCPARPFSAIYVEGNERHRII